jgi:integrase
MPNKRANNEGSIRQRPDGRWEARYTVGRDPGTGKQIQKSVYADTQKEVRQRLQQIIVTLDEGTYIEPSKMTVAMWLDIWLEEYTGNVKDHTRVTYETQVRIHIKPSLGVIKLAMLKPHMIQSFYNRLQKGTVNQAPLSPKTIKNNNGVFHRAMDQAVVLGYIKSNPCTGVKLPRVETPEMHPLTESEMNAFFEICAGNDYELLFKVGIFTGMRQSEIVGLTWDRVNFEAGTIYVDRQLIYVKRGKAEYKYAPPKNDKPRKLTVAQSAIRLLQEQKRRQAQMRLAIGPLWDDSNFPGLVFTNAFGGHLVHNTLSHNFKRLVTKIGIASARFHDMRHTYAVNSLRAGDDVKTVQENLGDATAAFTLDRYAHYTEDMRRDSAARMEAFIQSFLRM